MSANVPAGVSKTLTLRVPKAALAAVRRGRRVSLVVTISASDTAGNAAGAKRTIKLMR